jgi:hypothetical protein
MKRRKKWILLIVFIFQALNFDPVFARLTPEQLPPDLAPWRNWAIYGHESELCPQRFDDPTITRCQWPTRLQLDIADDGARFEQHAYVFTPEWIVLPGGGGAWPDGVTLDGQAAVVIPHDGSPAIHAPVGEHHIQGRFFWRRIPDDLLLPPSLGLLSISHNGIADEASPIIDQNRLLLNAKPRPQREENLVRVHIFRLFRDTIPM